MKSKKEKSMKNGTWCVGMLVLGMMFGPGESWAIQADPVLSAQIENLRMEMQKMRQDYDGRVSALQSQVDELKKSSVLDSGAPAIENKAGKPPVSIDYVGRQQGPFNKGGLIIEEPSGFAKVALGGYADIEFENFQNKQSTFNAHRFVLNVGAEIGDRLKFYSELENEYGGVSAQSSGGVGETKVEQAWIDYLIGKPINVRAGAILVPFGRYNLYHDSDLQDLTDRPLMERRVVPTTWTEAGAGFYGEFHPKFGSYEDLEIGYEAYFINGLNNSFSDTGMRGATGSMRQDNNNSKAIVGRVTASPAVGQELGLSGYVGDFNGKGDAINGVNVDFLTTWGPLEVVGEYAYLVPSESRITSIPAGGTGNISNYMTGTYLQANYHFWFDCLNDTFLGRSFDNPTFTLVGRYDWVGIDDDADTAGRKDNDEQRFTLGINYRPVESWVWKLEYQNNISRNYEALERGKADGWITSIAMGF